MVCVWHCMQQFQLQDADIHASYAGCMLEIEHTYMYACMCTCMHV